MTSAFAIFRYWMWAIDVIIRRTWVYGALAALLILIYAMSILGLELMAVVGSDVAAGKYLTLAQDGAGQRMEA